MKNVGSLISEILTWLTNMGYAGIAIGLMIEIIPSEIVLAYGGYMVSEGTIGFIGAIIAGVIGGTIAQIFIYWIGRYGGRPFLDKYGKYLLIKSIISICRKTGFRNTAPELSSRLVLYRLSDMPYPFRQVLPECLFSNLWY